MNTFKKSLVIIGAGGHAKVCYDIAILMNKWSEIIILDDNSNNVFFDIKGSILNFEKYIESSDFFVAIGDNNIRKEIINKILMKQGNLATLVHCNAVIAKDVEIESGTVIMAGVVINSSTKIGQGCIINTSSSIDHDNIINDFVHISPGAHLAGGIEIGSNSWIGIGTIIINNLTIANNVILGANSLVLNNINIKGIYVGSPVRKL